MPLRSTGSTRRRGRPSKFGRPSQVVALTLPEDVVDRLRRVHRDLGWAIVKLVDDQTIPPTARRQTIEPDVELVTVAERRALIVVNREVIKDLPGVNFIPLSGNRAFLALDIDKGMSDLELAVGDRLAEGALGRQERQALGRFQSQLRSWRHDDTLRFHTRAIIVGERTAKMRLKRPQAAAARSQTTRRQPKENGAQDSVRSRFDRTVHTA